ncbi:MAG: phage tail protein [Gammaproteobacteria bacterium]
MLKHSPCFVRALTFSALLGLPMAAAQACGSQPFLGEVCQFAFTFCPQGFAPTNGQLLSISQNTALFSLLGTTYGGDGRTTFALPDTRGRVAVTVGQGPGLSNYDLGQGGGAETQTLTLAQIPAHSHTASTNVTVSSALRGTDAIGNVDSPLGHVLANVPRLHVYSTNAANVDMGASVVNTANATTSVGNAGGGQPVSVMQPYLVLQSCIALQGIFPSRP